MAFKIRIEPSGHEFSAAAGETILEAAIRQGFMLPYSCRNGSCATCKGKLLAGRVEHAPYEPHALSDAERADGLALFCRARPAADVVIEAREIGAAKDIVIKTLPCRVARVERLAHDVMGLYLKLPQSERLQFLAGQYIDILLRDGRRRSFSLANAPHDDEHLQLHIRQVPGGLFSGHVFTKLRDKDLLRFQGPLGTFFLREDSDRPIIFLAGGTGFAPVKSMIEHALASGTTRPMHLYWGVRARRDLYMHELAGGWARSAGLHYTPVLSEPGADDDWRGRTGWVHQAVGADFPDLSGFEVYASGPPAMIAAARDAFLAGGLDPQQLYSDAFEYAKDGAQTSAGT